MNEEGIKQIPDLIKELYSVVNKLEDNFPGRHFTLDGHLVGSIGEVIASYYYNLELLQASVATHDAQSTDGKMVQIKATQGDTVGLRSEPQHLLVIKILKDGNIEEIFNGPGKIAWDNSGKMQKNGQRPISVNKLRNLMESMPDDIRLKSISNFNCL